MITRFDHFVLTVRSVADTVAFYEQVLGFEARTAKDRTALHFADHKINLHEVGHLFSPQAAAPTPGSGDFCLVTNEPLDAVIARLGARGVSVEVGPVARTGARASLRSVYLRDPDGNLVEIANETG